VLAFAAVSYVAALRAARGREMRTQLLPGRVDRELKRQRRQASARMKARLGRGKSARGKARPSSGTGPPVDPEAPTAP